MLKLQKIKSNLLFYSLYYAEAYLRIFATGQHSSFRRNVAAVATVGNTVSYLTDPRFEHQASSPESNALPLDRNQISLS